MRPYSRDQPDSAFVLRTRDEEYVVRWANIHAQPARSPAKAHVMPGGVKLNVTWCDPAGTVAAWKSPLARRIVVL